MSKIFAISSLIMISFFVDIDLVWVEAPRWSLVILVVLFCKLITLRPGQRCKPCSLHILFNKVTQMFRFVAATPIDWWKCKVTLSIPQDLLVVWACCRDCSSIYSERNGREWGLWWFNLRASPSVLDPDTTHVRSAPQVRASTVLSRARIQASRRAALRLSQVTEVLAIRIRKLCPVLPVATWHSVNERIPSVFRH